ncbi:TPA: ead/Ea22-like family protein [Enterobacter cloacae]
MSKIDKQALREAAEKASTDNHTQDEWFHYLRCSTPETVLALLDELEANGNRINRLEAIVAVAEQRNALMREWKRALKVPSDLVDNQVPVVIHGMVIRLERLKETEAKLEAAEKRIAELEAREVKLPELKMLSDYLAEVTMREREDILVGVRLEFFRALEEAGVKVSAAAGKGE